MTTCSEGHPQEGGRRVDRDIGGHHAAALVLVLLVGQTKGKLDFAFARDVAREVREDIVPI